MGDVALELSFDLLGDAHVGGGGAALSSSRGSFNRLDWCFLFLLLLLLLSLALCLVIGTEGIRAVLRVVLVGKEDACEVPEHA